MSQKQLEYSLDSIDVQSNNRVVITGWAISRNDEEKVYVDIRDENDQEIKYRKVRMIRNDVALDILGVVTNYKYGFRLSFKKEEGKKYYLVFYTSQCRKKISLSPFYILKNRLLKKAASVYLKYFSLNRKRNKPISYEQWLARTEASKKELTQQAQAEIPDDAPLFSIVIPLYKTREKYLSSLISSIKSQTYRKFEVCFADGSPEGKSLDQKIRKYTGDDSRFKYKKLNENKGISGNTNAALAMAEGDFIVLCDHDDVITPDALYEFAKAIRNNPECDCIYSDEDKMDEKGKSYYNPYFKPDYSIDLLTSNNYICHLFAVRKSLVDQYGNFNSDYDGSQDYDFILRMTEQARKTVHVPKILYHWRAGRQSTAMDPKTKLYAYDAGARAIRSHYARVWPQFEIEKIEKGADYGIYHTVFHFEEYPLISVIIPNMDHTDDLDKAIRSIEKDTWPNKEFIIVENNSRKKSTEEYYRKIQNEFDNVHVVHYSGSFNYSKINNFGTHYSKGQYYFFVNNDIEEINHRSISEIMGYLQRPDVGIVGCRLLYPDHTLQHAGVIVGIGGIADHAFKGRDPEKTYFNHAMEVQDLSAVTAAAMMTKKDVFESAGGFSEDLAVAFNDIDYCLKVRKNHKLIVYNPYAEFYHYESKSRGSEDTTEKQIRFTGEVSVFLRRWEDYIVKGDPYYNRNLTVNNNDYSLRNLNIENVGEPFYSKEMRHMLMTESPEDIVNGEEN